MFGILWRVIFAPHLNTFLTLFIFHKTYCILNAFLIDSFRQNAEKYCRDNLEKITASGQDENRARYAEEIYRFGRSDHRK